MPQGRLNGWCTHGNVGDGRVFLQLAGGDHTIGITVVAPGLSNRGKPELLPGKRGTPFREPQQRRRNRMVAQPGAAETASEQGRAAEGLESRRRRAAGWFSKPSRRWKRIRLATEKQ